MKKNNEREPDLIQYRLEYCLNDDLPSERFFMATDPRDALSQLAYSCIKYIPVDSLNEEEQDSFAKAFANPTKPFVQAPDLLPIPEPIPDIDFPEPEPELPPAEPEKTEEQNEHGEENKANRSESSENLDENLENTIDEGSHSLNLIA